MRPLGDAVPLADAGELARFLRRGRVARLTLAAALVCAALAAFVFARGLDPRETALIPPGSNGVIVVDVSASISATTYRQIGRVLGEAAARGGRYGVVMFSDSAYEAVPPGTDARELRRFQRFFTPLAPHERRAAGGMILTYGNTSFPANPWQSSLTAGTRISRGLRLAREVLARDRVERPAVVLVSDLATDQSDIPLLAEALIGYVRAGIPLRVVALAASPQDKAFFSALLARGGGGVVDAPRPSAPASDGSWLAATTFPGTLVLAVAAVLALLAANEFWCGRLTWGRRDGRGVAA